MQKRLRILIWILGPPLIALFVWIGFMPFFTKQINWVVVAILLPASVIFSTWLTYEFLDSVSYKFAITDGQFVYRSLVRYRVLDFRDVRGFRIDDNYIHIEPKDQHHKPIRLDKHTGDPGEIMEFLNQRFEALDNHDALNEEGDIRTNNEFGVDEKSRLVRFKQAKFTSWTVNAIGIGICVWLFIKPVPYDIALYTAVAYPFFVYAAVMCYRGMIKFEEIKDSKYPTVAFGFTSACCGLMVRVLDFDILDYGLLWVYSTIPFLGMLMLFLIAGGSITQKKFNDIISTFILIGFVAIYSVCGYAALNCLPDNSKPVLYTANVLEKTTTQGKTTSYYILLPAWGPKTESEKLSITRAEYDRAEVGEEVQIFLKDGFLNVPWFYLEVD